MEEIEVKSKKKEVKVDKTAEYYINNYASSYNPEQFKAIGEPEICNLLYGVFAQLVEIKELLKK